nr:hypothetical protein [Candidatus Neomarinimicrobiota bacterium]
MVYIDRQVDTIGPDDLLKPEIRLIQATGGEKAKEAGAKPGQLYNVATGEIYDSIEFVVLDIQKGRTYWGRDTLGDDPPLCSSTNARGYESVNGDDCRKCEHLLDNAAMVDAKTRREKCCPNYTILGIMVDTLTPFMLRAAGISATPVASLLTQIVYNKATHNPENPAIIDWHRFKITVSGSEQKTKNGTAYALHFKNVTLFGDPQLEQSMFQQSAILLGQGNLLALEGGQSSASLPATPAREPA